MNKSPELLTQPTIVVVPWVDPVVDAAGASLFSRYVELYWLPVLGPSALWILAPHCDGLRNVSRGVRIGLRRHRKRHRPQLHAEPQQFVHTLVATLLVFRSNTASPGRSGGALLLACN
jgi:hypothetical protein